MNLIEKYFNKLRFDEKFHLGMGDIRLTIGMQEEIAEMVETHFVPYHLVFDIVDKWETQTAMDKKGIKYSVDEIIKQVREEHKLIETFGLNAIDNTSKEGKLLLAALSILTTECRTSKTPDQVILELVDKIEQSEQ